MEEDKIKEIFIKFSPEYSCGDNEFMSKIQSNMDAVDEVKNKIVKTQKMYRNAAILASIVGFVSGMIFSLFLKIFMPAIDKLKLSLIPENSIEICGWCIVAFISVLFTTLSYRLAIHYQTL